jgi:LL-diaminopimelate aminotransferase
MLALAFLNPGDEVLITTPSVSTLPVFAGWMGANVIQMPITADSLPSYENIPQKTLNKSKILYISYPNNPTGGIATIDFFKETIEFARENKLLVIHDATYAALVYEEGKQLSFLSVDGAKKVGVELHSFSHAFNMSGFGIGFMAGNKQAVKAIKDIYDKSSARNFKPVRQAVQYALLNPGTSYDTALKYKRRMGFLCKTLKEIGIKSEMPLAGCYLFIDPPDSTELGDTFLTPYHFEEYLREKDILVKSFEEGVRFSVTFPAFGEIEEQAVMTELKDRLKNCGFMYK